ncbi:MAG TPA: hypothetical protein VMJ75_03870 [Candidatus Acidoferrales bacterium]|nr:hypothetical protein [Candidatus Acidoferrales bacterium]
MGGEAGFRGTGDPDAEGYGVAVAGEEAAGGQGADETGGAGDDAGGGGDGPG